MMYAFSFTNHMNLISIINVGFNIGFRITIDQDVIITIQIYLGTPQSRQLRS